jgi:LuxR family maltose regulon positive regulatory protein
MYTRPPATLIRTKLYRPRATEGLVPLLRIRQALDLELDRPLTLVCAPAGFGKTTLLSDWVAHCPQRSAWLSLDEQDNDPAGFLTYVIAAVRTLFPAACAHTAALLHGAELPPLSLLSATLTNDIDSLAEQQPAGQRFLLVLDDYHLIHNLDVHQLLDSLLLHPPRSLHLVLGTRHDPPLALAARRARGQLAEVRMAALRFTPAETAEFVRRAVRLPVDAELLDALQVRTEGWVAALRFAALALNMLGRDMAVPAALRDDRYVMEYLLNEVLARLPQTVQDFLLHTAILNRLCGPLCAALEGEPAGGARQQQLLHWLEQEDLFTLALDDQGQWYRYHHLLQKLLQDQLAQRFSPAVIAALHARASAWYAAHGYMADAIGHALAAGNEEHAALLVAAHRHTLMNQEQWQALEHLLQLLPRRLVETHVELLLAEAWLLQSRWRIGDTRAVIARADMLLADETATLPEPGGLYLRGELDTLRSHVAFHAADFPSQLAYAARALQDLPEDFSSVRGHAWMDYAVAHYLLGHTEAWRTAVHTALDEDRLHGNAFPMRVLQGYCFLAWMDADLPGLRQGAAFLLKLATERELALGESWGHYFLGAAAYQAGDLPTAEREFGAVVNRRYLAHGFTYLQASFGLATVLLARGDDAGAEGVVDTLLAFAWERGDQNSMDEVQAFQAFLGGSLGRRLEAQRWVGSYDRTQPLIPLIMFHATPVAYARLLLQGGTQQGFEAAAAWLARLHGFVTATFNTRYLIEVLALQALLGSLRRSEGATGPRQAGLLAEALALAEPGGLVRVFVDLGPAMAVLLSDLAAQGGGSPFLAKVLAAFPPHMRAAQSAPGAHLPQEPWRRPAPHVAGRPPLSPRELEVLALLAQRFTVREVAARLVISELTAKRHTANIYQKLGVNRRKDAVDTARDAGLLA